ncbi:MAG: protein-L-isoaspartate(D-aspartate) O-methyltransferase [Rhizobiaceae bacterium]|nr:protein-L-isoaspartate(D-aspartate) O-methyltransferase [Rhizobiaceae bacterium]
MTKADQEGFAAFLLRMRARGINDAALFAAIEATGRRDFVPGPWQDAVWLNRTLPIPCGEAIEGIDLQAMIFSALSPQQGQRVLEIGTGSGFTAAVMGKLAGRVLSIERYRTLVAEAGQRLAARGIDNVILRQADGVAGAPSEGPFDRIVVWAAFDGLPRHFVEQLASNGTMVCAIGPGDGAQNLVRLTKIGSRFDREDIGEVRFQPFASGVAATL